MSNKPKTQLTPLEATKAYIANVHEGVDQDVLAMIFGVNSGRISEAVQAIRFAAENPKKVYLMQKGEAP